MMPVIFAIAAGSIAASLEALYKLYGHGSWSRFWYLVVPASIVLNYCIYLLVTSGPRLLVAVAMFSLTTLTLRILVSVFVVDEPLRNGNFVAAGALLIGVCCGLFWR